jgi:hypothetical protein
MDAREAITLVTEWILRHDLDYPTDGLEAHRFDGGWRVYAPVDVDLSDPMKFLQMPVGRAVFLISDSGRIKETSTSVPPRRAHEEFLAEQRADEGTVDTDAIAADCSRLLDPIVRQLAQLGPPGWQRLEALFAVTVSAEVSRLRFWTDRPTGLVPVPASIVELVRQQRHVAARMPAGPWWRLLMTVTHHGDMTANYDYGDQRFPADDLLAPEHYRSDLATYPRGHVPAWLADYLTQTAAPGPTPPPEPPSVRPTSPDSGPALAPTTKNGSRQSHADPQTITCGGKPIALDQAGWVQDREAVLILAAVAGGGLTRADLAALTGYTPDELDAHLATALRTGLRAGASRWTGDTLYVVQEGKRRQEITAAAGTAAVADCVGALRAWAEAHRELGWPATTPEYLLDGYFRLLESSADIPAMTACATDPRRHERLLELTGGDLAATYEITTCHAAIGGQAAPDQAAASALAAARERLTRRNNRLPASLPATLAAVGEPARAEQLACSITDPAQQARALHKLAIALINHGHLEQARHTLTRLVSVVSTLKIGSSPRPPHPALSAVMELADAGQWAFAERVARAITNSLDQAEALRSLVSAQITDGHLDQAEHLALSMNFSEGDHLVSRSLEAELAHQAMTLVIAAVAAAGHYSRAEALARAFPDRDAIKYHGGFLALPELVSALAAAGRDRFRELVQSASVDWMQEDLMSAACLAIAKTGDFDRAEELARSIDTGRGSSGAFNKIIAQMFVMGAVDRAEALAQARAQDFPGFRHPEAKRKGDQPLPRHFQHVLANWSWPGVLRTLVDQGHGDVVESYMRRKNSKGYGREEALSKLAVAIAASGDPHWAERLYVECHESLYFDTLAVLKAVARAYADAGDLDQAERVAYSASTPFLTEQSLCHIAARLVGRGDADLAEQLANRFDDPQSRAEVLAAVAAASAAHGDAARARTLAERAATLARTNAESLSYQELLRMADNWPNRIPAESRIRRFPIGIAESSRAPVYVDFNQCLHCIIIGDAESGKTSLLRSIVHSICASNTNDQMKIILVDYRRTLLNEIPGEYNGGWATNVNTATELMEALRDSLRERMPDPEVGPEQRVNRSWWSGPDVCVIIDDYDMVAASTSNPIDALLEFLPHAHALGLHVIIARRAGGAGRAMLEPVLARMRDLGSAGFIMSGERGEGVLIGTTKPSNLPPGQGMLVTAGSEELVRISWLPPASSGTPGAIAP